MDTEDKQPRTAAQWVKQHSKHKKNIRLVLRELADLIDDGNDCPSHSELAEITGLTKPTIQHALEVLETDGTITITRHGGGVKRGGKKNCYALPGMTADPVKKPGQNPLPGQNDPVKPVVPGKENPVKITVPGQNAEPHVHAAGANNALSVQELVLSDKNNQTDYQRLTDTRNIPPQTQDDLNRDFEAASPQERERAIQAYSKANPPVTHQDNPEPPGSAAPPLPPDIVTSYRDKWDTPLEGDELDKMQTIIKKHGIDALKAQMAVTGDKDADGNPLGSPAGYMLKTLNNLKSQGKQPGQTTQRKAAPASRQPVVDGIDYYPADMQFTAPPPKADTPKGALAAWAR